MQFAMVPDSWDIPLRGQVQDTHTHTPMRVDLQQDRNMIDAINLISFL